MQRRTWRQRGGAATILCFLIGLGNAQGKPPAKAASSQPLHAYLVADLETGKILRKKNIGKACYPASLTKMMTLYLLFDALRRGEIQFTTEFCVSPHAARQMAVSLGTKPGERLTVKTVIEALIVKSANDVAVVAAEGLAGSVSAFAERMNKQARHLGMTETRFFNPSGVPDPRQKTSARDMARLARALLRDFPEFADFFKLRTFRHKGCLHYTHNHLLNVFQGTSGMKTGFTNASGYNIAISVVRFDAQHRPHQLICIVLGGKTRLARDQEVIHLLESVLLERRAFYYDANASLPAVKTGLPLDSPSKVKPKMVRAAIQTQDGLNLLLKSYQEEQRREANRESTKEGGYFENFDILFQKKKIFSSSSSRAGARNIKRKSR